MSLIHEIFLNILFIFFYIKMSYATLSNELSKKMKKDDNINIKTGMLVFNDIIENINIKKGGIASTEKKYNFRKFSNDLKEILKKINKL